MSNVQVIIDGITPAGIEAEGIPPTIPIGPGYATKIVVITLDAPAGIEAEGIPAVEITGASPELILTSPAEIKAEGVPAVCFGAEVALVDLAEIETDSVTPEVALTVDVSPAEVEIEGVPAASVSASGVEIVVSPAEITIDGVSTCNVFFSITYSIVNLPAKIEIEGVPAASFGAEIFLVNPAEIEIEGITPTVGTVYYRTLSDGIFMWDLADTNWLRTVGESLTATDTSTIQLNVLITEYLSLRETLLDNVDCTHTLTETMRLNDAPTLSLFAVINEALTATDTTSLYLALLILDYLTIRDSLGTQATFNREVSESMAATDAVVFRRVESILEEMSAADTVTMLLALQISDTMNFADAVLNTCHFNKDLTEYMTAVDSVRFSFDLSVTDTAAVVDSLAGLLVAELALSESVAFVDAVTPTSYALLTVNESLVFYEIVSSTGHFYQTISEGLNLGVTVTIDGETYECFVLNTPKFLPSVYSGFNFNSYCEYQGRSFGANSEGIFELAGETDNGDDIHTGAQFHETDFGMRNQKRFRKAFIGVDGTSPVMVMETDNGERKSYIINDKGKVSASRSVHGREWVLSVADFDTLENIHLVPVILSRGK